MYNKTKDENENKKRNQLCNKMETWKDNIKIPLNDHHRKSGNGEKKVSDIKSLGKTRLSK